MADLVQVTITETTDLISINISEAGVIPGGTTGQSLVKRSNANFDTTWGNPSASVAWGGITGTLTNQTDLQTALNLKANADTVLANGKQLSNLMSSGLLTGGDLSINADPTKFDYTAGMGIIVDNVTDPANPVRTLVTWNAATGVTDPLIATDTTTFIYVDNTGTFHYRNTPLGDSERRYFFNLGWMDHPDTATITNVKIQPNMITDAVAQFNDFISNFGAFNVQGNEYTPLYALTIKRSAGKTFDGNANYWTDHSSPHVVVTNLESPVSMTYYYRNNSGGWFNNIAHVSSIDPNHWDDGSGVLASVPGGKWTIQIISFYSQTTANDIQYGQVVYDTLAAAQSALQVGVAVNPYNAYDTFRAWAIVHQGATDLTNANQALFVSAGKLGLTSVQSGGGTGGEVNTASNIGTAGIGLYDSKLGVNLQFKNIEGSSKITVSLDTPNKAVKIDAPNLVTNESAIAYAIVLGPV